MPGRAALSVYERKNMKIDLSGIDDSMEMQRIENILKFEWDKGVLNLYKRISPNARIKITLQKKSTPDSSGSKIYLCDIYDEKNRIIEMFRVINNKVVIGDMRNRKK